MSDPVAFAVNGRFLSQPMTGVQRYARNILSAMDAQLPDTGRSATVLAPNQPSESLDLHAMKFQIAGPMSGHAWEQLILPARWSGRLLNLCNTAPAMKADQLVCIHDASVFTAPQSYSAAFRRVYQTLQPHLARRSARITTVSANAAGQIAKHLPIAASEIAILPNGHEHALAWRPELATCATAIDAERPFVLAAGSRARHKNLRLLIDCAPALAEMGLDLVIAGGGAGIFANENLPSSGNVKLIGRVTDHDLAYLMDRALCLAFPSWTEGFGLPIVEAMARGLPVVSSDRASMPEVCGEAALLAPPDDAAAWIARFRELKNSPDLRNDLKGRGFEQVKKFSWKNSAAGYLDLLQNPAARLARPATSKPHRIAVVIATLGRPEIVSATVKHLLDKQTVAPHAVIISCVNQQDAGAAASYPGVRVLVGGRGLPVQRNAGLDALPPDTDIVAFFDDDFVADVGWLEAAGRAFAEEPDLVGFTGHVLADGIKGPGLSFDEAKSIIAQPQPDPDWTRISPYSPYGCNMAFRRSAIGDLRFDERLVLYGWLEDRDFGAALAKRGGRLAKYASARGVHMGVKGGRVSGDRLGYSQVVNPIYMMRKKTMTLGQVADHIFRNVASNIVRAPVPEPFIDRRGRLRGNLRALFDVVRGQLKPEKAANLQARS